LQTLSAWDALIGDSHCVSIQQLFGISVRRSFGRL
jgi:hypothetical protein